MPHAACGLGRVRCGLGTSALEGGPLTAVVLFPQVLGLRDDLHEAHPAARLHHHRRQLLHFPGQQEEGRCCARRRAAPLVLLRAPGRLP